MSEDDWIPRWELSSHKLRYRTKRRKTNQPQKKRENKMRAILTPDDLKKGDLVEPGWYPLEIVDYEEKEAETDGSTNCIFKFKIIDGPYKGVGPTRLFNEKALGFGKSLWGVLFGKPDPTVGYTGEQLSTESFSRQVGKKLKIYIKRGKSNKGNEFNDVVDFMPLEG